MANSKHFRFLKLPPNLQRKIVYRFLSGIKMFRAGGRYNVVEGETSRQRAPAMVEIGGEDQVLPHRERALVTNLMRNSMRNSSTARSIDQQRRVNVVGMLGGKMSMHFAEQKKTEAARPWVDWFNREWAPNAEFTDGMHFNELIKLALSSCDNAGDVVLLFDNGELCDSGRIRAFESDEIANLAPGAFSRRFGTKGYTQSQGRIYDRFGRSCGVCVSTSCRGLAEFPEKKCFVLMADPATDRRENCWAIFRHAWRFNQGRGVPPLAASIATLTDLTEIQGNETQATKLNSKMFAQLIDEAGEDNEVPADFDPSSVADGGEGDESSDTSEDAESSVQELDFESFKAIGAAIEAMPYKTRLELFDTKRPNQNMPQFISWLEGQVSASMGVAKVYATMYPESSYTAYRGAQCMTWPTFEEAQKALERTICDWAGRRALEWAERHHLVDGALPEGWKRSLSWAWPEMPEVNEGTAEDARQKKLKNLTTNYRRIYGPNWKDELIQIFDEIQFFKDHGVIHPSQETIAGAIVDNNKSGADTREGE